MSKRAVLAMLPGIFALVACEPAEETAPPGPAPQAMASDPADADKTEREQPADTQGGPRPMLLRSAWRAEGEEGAIYATYFDEEGRYRDLKNGELSQEGEWEIREDGAICFLPDGDNVRGDCWGMGPADSDGTIIVTHSSGRRIELERIDYKPPDDE